MKKKIAMLMATLMLTMALPATASADFLLDGFTDSERAPGWAETEPVTMEDAIDCIWVEFDASARGTEPITVNAGNNANTYVEEYTFDGYWVQNSGETYTIKNVGTDPQSYIYVDVQVFDKKTESFVIPIGDPETDVDTPTDFIGKYYGMGTRFLVDREIPEDWKSEVAPISSINGMQWVHRKWTPEFSEAETAGKRIYPGESATFTLPEEGGEDTFYIINTHIFFPGSFQYYWTSHNILINDALKAELTAKAEPETPAATETPAAPAATNFKDVPAGKYYAAPIAWAVENNITAGTSETTFSPEQTCTNAQILTFLWRAMGQPEATIENPFTDVDESKYYYKAALWAYENGLVEGNLFNASIPCTRAMTVEYQWKAAGKPEAQAAAFADVDSSAAYAKAVAWAVEAGITAGTSETTFSPDQTCTRGQIATFLYKNLAK